MGLAGADKNQVAFARYNRFVMALPSPARVVETRLHMRPAGGNATKLASRTQKETLSGPVWKARPAAIAAISSDSQSSAAMSGPKRAVDGKARLQNSASSGE